MRQVWSILATGALLFTLTIPVVVGGYLFASEGLRLSWGVVLVVLLVTTGSVVASKLVQIHRPHRFTRRTGMTWLDELVDVSFFGVGPRLDWTDSNPNLSLADLRQQEAPFIAQPTRPSEQDRVVAVVPSTYVPYTVARGDTFWSLAERLLGDGSRWVELHDANIGAEVAPGVVLKEGDILVPGWTIAAPQLEETA